MYFRYKAYEEGGPVREGIIRGTSAQKIREEIRNSGLHVVLIEEMKKAKPVSCFTRKKLALFASGWAALISAGIPVTEALSVLQDGRKKKEKQVLEKLQNTIEAGHGISDSFAESGAFPAFFCALLKVGELSGTLPEQLISAADYYKKEDEFLRNLQTALLYPLAVLLFALLVSVLVLGFLLPSFALLFDALAVPLPPMTKAALAFGLFLQRNGITILIFVALLFLAGFRCIRTEKGKEKTDRLLFRSAFVRQLILARFSRALSALLESGTTLSEALKETALMETNKTARQDICRWAAAVEKGGDFARLVHDAGWTGNTFSRMLRIGMESGQLPLFLKQADRWLTEEVEMELLRFRKMAEPVLLLIAGGMVAALVFSVLIPVFQAAGSGLGI